MRKNHMSIFKLQPKAWSWSIHAKISSGPTSAFPAVSRIILQTSHEDLHIGCFRQFRRPWKGPSAALIRRLRVSLY